MRTKRPKIIYFSALLMAFICLFTVILSGCNKDKNVTPEEPPAGGETVPEEEEQKTPYFSRESVNGVDYIYFGTAPDRVVSDAEKEALASLIESGAVTPDEEGIFSYKGLKYAVISAENGNEGRTLSTGAKVVSGGVYFVKFSAIKWRVIEEKNGVAILLSDSVIGMGVFNPAESFDSVTGLLKGSDVAANDYASSALRAYLTGDFQKSLFTDEELAHIKDEENAVKLLNIDKISQYSLYVEKGYMTTVSPTDYLILRGIDVKETSKGDAYYTGWWLAEGGKNKCFAKYVDAMGTYGENRVDNVAFSHGLRPLIELETGEK